MVPDGATGEGGVQKTEKRFVVLLRDGNALTQVSQEPERRGVALALAKGMLTVNPSLSIILGEYL